MDFNLPDFSTSAPYTEGHSVGCGGAIFVFLFVAILMAIFVAAIGWALKSAGV